jgi:CubicO group peptidase (beta-lactamase class C family)
MKAVSTGVLKLEDSLTQFFPAAFLGASHRTITIRHLLNHCSGLAPYEPFYLQLIQMPPEARKAWLLESVLRSRLVSKPGTTCQYSDLGFMVLANVLETVLERPLHDLAEEFFTRARASGLENLAQIVNHVSNDLTGTGTPPLPKRAELPWIDYMPMRVPRDPIAHPLRTQAPNLSFAATEQCPWRRRLLKGEVHDENAYCLNGVAGHAGLFGSALGVYGVLAFLWRVYRGLFESGEWSRDVVQCFWSRQDMVPGATWALGYDTPSVGYSSAGSHFSMHSIGHLGFTGTSFWIDLDRELLVILLTNRVHPSRNNEKIKVFRPVLHDLVMETFDD